MRASRLIKLEINHNVNMIRRVENPRSSMLRRIGLIALLIAIVMPGSAKADAVDEWLEQIVLRLASNKRFPPGALGQTGTAKVGFVLDRNGKLVSRWLEESTGIPALDEESLAIVERAQPFPIPPPDLDENRLKLIAPLIFAARFPRRDTSPDVGKVFK
jgi:periplasmic protein TonB